MEERLDALLTESHREDYADLHRRGVEELVALMNAEDRTVPEAALDPAENAEGDFEGGAKDIESIGVTEADAVVGVSASGRTPYVIGAVRRARERGALTVGLACNRPSELGREAEHAIEVDTGPEVISGATRLKAGTAQKLILNTISTVTMTRLGKVFGGLMVDVRPTNEKPRPPHRRSRRESLSGRGGSRATRSRW